MMGDTSVPFVDVSYEVDGKQLTASNLNTDGISTRDYPIGGAILLLVNPNDPSKCVVKLYP
ncbi:DUF3592 domain-containing protein [Rhizobium sp. YTU87027]|uniref:DUF3592 domain-containing protein n=1 Tax=Rhizobium sp. YTU87027 TaxID=3417741 RepID=UPI003D698AEF